MTWGSSEDRQRSANQQSERADSGFKGPAGSCTLLTSRSRWYPPLTSRPPVYFTTITTFHPPRTTSFRPPRSFVDPGQCPVQQSPLLASKPTPSSAVCMPPMPRVERLLRCRPAQVFIDLPHRVHRPAECTVTAGLAASPDDMSVGLRPHATIWDYTNGVTDDDHFFASGAPDLHF